LSKMELAPKLVAPDPQIFNYDAYERFIDKSLPVETPLIYGLHPNAEIGFLTNKAEDLFQIMMRLGVASDGASNGSSSGNANSAAGGEGGKTEEVVEKKPAASSSGNILRETLADLTKRCPAPFNLIDLAHRAKQRLTDADGPYTVVLIQECTRLSTLVTEISSTLDELQKGLNGQLNMSQGMEDMAQCLELNMVPGRNPFHACNWERYAWPSRKTLSLWFADLLLRRSQLTEWSNSLSLPYSVWLPGLMNPTALLTAIKQVLCLQCLFVSLFLLSYFIVL